MLPFLLVALVALLYAPSKAWPFYSLVFSFAHPSIPRSLSPQHTHTHTHTTAPKHLLSSFFTMMRTMSLVPGVRRMRPFHTSTKDPRPICSRRRTSLRGISQLIFRREYSAGWVENNRKCYTNFTNHGQLPLITSKLKEEFTSFFLSFIFFLHVCYCFGITCWHTLLSWQL